jgi:hypothetical protein
MTIPTRPVSGAPIASVWGQEIHDRVFAPKGGEVAGTLGTSVGTTPSGLNISIATDDPGGWLGTNLIEAPADSEGLYLIVVRMNTVNGATTSATRAILLLNDAEVARAEQDGENAVNVIVSVVAMLDLVPGDQLKVQAQKRGTGTSPDVELLSLEWTRLGAEHGA